MLRKQLQATAQSFWRMSVTKFYVINWRFDFLLGNSNYFLLYNLSIPLKFQILRINKMTKNSMNNKEMGIENVCRICRDEETDDNKLVRTPCDCTGSIGFIHFKCYKMWRKTTHKIDCDICEKAFILNSEHSSLELFTLRLQCLFQTKYLGRFIWRFLNIFLSISTTFDSLKVFMLMVMALQSRMPDILLMGLFISLIIQFDVLVALNLVWIMDCSRSMRRIFYAWWIDFDEEQDDSYLTYHSSNDSLFDRIFLL